MMNFLAFDASLRPIRISSSFNKQLSRFQRLERFVISFAVLPLKSVTIACSDHSIAFAYLSSFFGAF
jgi:hypothetical protein